MDIHKLRSFIKKIISDPKRPIIAKLSKIMLVSFVVGLIGSVVCAAAGAEMLAAVFAMQIFAVFGTCFFIGSFGSGIENRIRAFSVPFLLALFGYAVMIGFVMLFFSCIGVITGEEYQSIKGAIVTAALFIGGVCQILPTVYYRIMLKKRCTEPVKATCEQHGRMKLGELSERPVYGTAPVWHYSYGGQEYHSVDNVHIKKGSMPSVGETCDILIDPNRPGMLLSDFCRISFGRNAIFGLVMIALAVYFI